MATVDPGTVIEIGTCSGCGKPVEIKANKNQIAYYFCIPNDRNDGVGCSHHEKWGRVASNTKLRAFWDAKRAHDRKGNDDDRSNDRLATGSEPKPAETEKPEQVEPERHDKPEPTFLAGLREYVNS
jgi:hypothetical protein